MFSVHCTNSQKKSIIYTLIINNYTFPDGWEAPPRNDETTMLINPIHLHSIRTTTQLDSGTSTMELQSVVEHGGGDADIASQQVSIISSSEAHSFEDQEPMTIINLFSSGENSLQQASTMPNSINTKKRKYLHQGINISKRLATSSVDVSTNEARVVNKIKEILNKGGGDLNLQLRKLLNYSPYDVDFLSRISKILYVDISEAMNLRRATRENVMTALISRLIDTTKN